MKPAKACQQCRDGKRRCDRPEPRAPCGQCFRRKLSCSSTIVRLKQLLSPQPSLSSPARLTSRHLPSPESQHELCDLYLSHIHDKPHTLFHEPTLRCEVAKGKLSRPILYGVMGLSARFSAHAEIRSQTGQFAMDCKRELKLDLEHICLENVQACILAGNLCGAEGNNDTEALFFGLY